LQFNEQRSGVVTDARAAPRFERLPAPIGRAGATVAIAAVLLPCLHPLAKQ
jgi:hypothetical protein